VGPGVRSQIEFSNLVYVGQRVINSDSGTTHYIIEEKDKQLHIEDEIYPQVNK
jgi:hypothetical protein